MKFSFYKRPFILCLSTIFCLVATVVQTFAQSQLYPILLEFNACNHELRVFNDGTMVESYRGKTTQRQLSGNRMKKLRQVIESRPCIKEWQLPTLPATVSAQQVIALDPNAFTVSTTYYDDCMISWVGAGFGLDEIKVTISSLDGQVEPIPVYVVCDGAEERDKKSAKRNYQNELKPGWHRFLADVSKAVGSKSFLKGCDCWKFRKTKR